MSAIASPSHFHQLAAADPQAICSRVPCGYDPQSGIFSLTAWDVNYRIDPAARNISAVDAGRSLHDYFDIFLLHYLLNDHKLYTQGEWISEKDMPGGPTFFRGPHAIPTEWISRRFGNDLGSFTRCCSRLSGAPLDLADAAFEFTIVPHIKVALLYWIGDDDFPAEAKILYDKSLTDFFALDVVYALAITVCNRFGNDA